MSVMSSDRPFMDKLRSFLGIHKETPRNEFRNPIWDDHDDDDDDELYTRDRFDASPHDLHDLHDEFARQMHGMFQSFGSIFGDMKTFFHDLDSAHIESFTNTPLAPIAPAPIAPAEPDNFDSNRIRDYYLKPGYHNNKQNREDVDLDGKISSNDIAGLLKQRDEDSKPTPTPFNGHLVPGRSFCRTIITTSVTKADGTRETKRIVKNGHDVVEESVTTVEPDPKGVGSSMESFSNPINIMMYSNVMTDLGSLLKNFY